MLTISGSKDISQTSELATPKVYKTNINVYFCFKRKNYS
ncbi:hypothetical protein T190130A13A_10328 [Tenacibaculum sp. 190130A14a]|uniref:Uncharacterized protein n=1 Tax=Tenacibaculum polynesiense TaxID=3137857 RepID=A0ABP1F093_9FLAO